MYKQLSRSSVNSGIYNLLNYSTLNTAKQLLTPTILPIICFQNQVRDGSHSSSQHTSKELKVILYYYWKQSDQWKKGYSLSKFQNYAEPEC